MCAAAATDTKQYTTALNSVPRTGHCVHQLPLIQYSTLQYIPVYREQDIVCSSTLQYIPVYRGQDIVCSSTLQ